MAISYVATSAFVTGANPTVAVPTGYAEKDLLVIVTTGTATPTTPAGWTSRAAQAATGFITILYKFATGTEASVALTLAGTTSTAVMVAYRGVSATDTITAFTTGAGGATGGTLTTTYANEFIVYACSSAAGAATTWTLGPGTSRGNAASTTTTNGLLIADEQQTAAGLSTARTCQNSGLQTVSMVGFSIIPSGRYWVGGTGTWTTTTTNWSFSSGGASGAPAPTANDPVTFDQAATYTVTMTGALTCFGMTVSAGTVTFATGTTPTLTNSGSMSLVAGTVWTNTGLLTFNSTSTGRTVTTNAVTINSPITFDGVGGNWSLGSALSTGATLTTTLNNGTLTLNGFDLSTGIFSSSVATARTIAFGTNFINLVHTTAATTVLNMATVTLFTWSGTGGFKADASITRTFTVGTTGGSTTTAPNLSITTGAAIPTITTASWINNLDFTGGTNTPAVTTVNLAGSLTLATGGTYTNLSINAVGTGTITPNGKSIAAFTVNNGAGTTTLAAALGVTTYTQTAGTINFASFNLTCSSTVTFTAGTLTNLATVSCVSWTQNGGAITLSSGNTITVSDQVVSYTINAGTFTYSGGTLTLGGSAPTFNHVGGDVITTVPWTMTTNTKYFFNQGSITLGGDLTTGAWSAFGGAARAHNFGIYNIILASTVAGTLVYNSSGPLNTFTGTGGFTADASITRTFQSNTNAVTPTNNPRLSITSGSAQPSISGIWGDLNFTGSSTTPATAAVTLSGSLTLSSGGTYTGLSVTMNTSGTITSLGKTIAALTIASITSGTTTLLGNLGVTTFSITGGTIDFASYNLSCSSSFTNITGTLTNIGTITCTTFQNSNVLFNFSSGTITPSVSFVTTTSSVFTYSGTAVLSAVPTFTQTAGSVTFNKAYALTTTGTYTLGTGTLTLGANLTTGAFITTGTSTRSIAFSTNQITLTGNNATIWDGGGTGITYTGTPTIVSNYTGSVGTRTINVGTGWTEATAFDVKTGAATGISIGTSATDIVAIAGNIKVFDLTGMLFTYTSGTMSIYGDYTIPATGGSISTSASITTFASTNATARVLTVGRTINFPIQFSGIGGTFNLGSNLTVGLTSSVSLNNGTLVLNGYNLTTGFFNSNNSNSRSIQFGSNSITVNGQSGTIYDFTTITNFTVTGTPTINVTSTTGTIAVIPGPFTEANAFNFNISATPNGPFSIFTVAGHTANNVDFTGFTGTIAATLATTIYGNYTLSSGTTVTASANTMTFGATSGTKTITTSGKTMPPIAINGIGGTFNLGGNLTSSGLVQVLAGTFNTTSSNYAVTCTQFDSSTNTNTRSISLNGSTVTISGTAGITLDSTNLTFNAGTSQITLSNATSTVISAIGGVTFYNVSCTGGGTVSIGTTAIYNNLTFTNGPTNASVVTISATQTINGTLSSSASTTAITRLQLQSSSPGTQITISAAAVSLFDVDFSSIYASGAAIPFTGQRLGNLGNNTNITFGAGKQVYWSLAAGGNWNSIAWATSVGGTPDVNNYPLAQDTAYFSNTGLNTGATVTINGNWVIGTINTLGSRSNAMTLAIGTTTPQIYGNWTTGASTTITGTGAVTFVGQGTTQFLYAGSTFTPPINVSSVGGTVKLSNAITMGATTAFTLTNGILDLNGSDLTTGTFISNNSNNRSIYFGSNNIILATTTAAALNLDMANTTGFVYTGTGGFVSGMSTTRTFTCGTTASVSGSLLYTGGQRLSLAASSAFDLSGGTWTIEFWMRSTATPTAGNQCRVFLFGTNQTTSGFVVGYNNDGTITGGQPIAQPYVPVNPTVVVSAAGAITLNTWIHVAMVSNAGSTTIYINGVQSGSTVALTEPTSSSPTLNIGYDTVGTVNFQYQGYLSNIRIVKGVAVYTGNFTPSSSPLTATQNSGTNINAITGTQTSLLLNTPNNAGFLVDSSVNNFAVTNNGSITANALTPITFIPAAGTPPNLALSSGASIPTITINSTFNILNFTGSTCTPAVTTVNLNSDLTLASGGTYTNLSAVLNNAGTFNTLNKSMAALTIQGTGNTINGTIACTIFTVAVGTFTFTSGTITPSTSVVITSGSFIYGGTATLGSVATFTHTAGSFTLNKAYALTATGTYTFTAGTITLTANLTTGIFSSSNTNTRNIAFGTNNIILAHTTAAQSVLAMAIATGFTYTSSGTFGSGTGCFQSAMSTTRVFVFGTTGGSSSNAPTLYLDSGASIATITTGSWFNELNYGTTGFSQSGTALNLNSLYSVSSTSVLSSLTIAMVGTGTINAPNTLGPVSLVAGTTTISNTLTCSTFTVNGATFNFNYSATLTPTTSFIINSGSFTYGGTATLSAVPTFTHTAGNVTFNKNYSLTVTGTYTHTAGNLTLASSVVLNTGIFSSNNANTRSIAFGASIASPSGSIFFNGSSQYLSTTGTTGDGLDLATGAPNWTIETWFYLDDTTSDHAIFWKGGTTGSINPSYCFFVGAGGVSQWIVGDGGGAGANALGGTILANTWYHFALVRNGNVLTSYLNGVQISSVTMSFTMSNTGNNTLTIGSSVADGSTRYLPGYISNFRIVKGIAVYTSAFTPSTTPLASTQLANTNGTPSAAITGTQTSLLLNTVFGLNYLRDSSSYSLALTNNGLSVSRTITPWSGSINLTHTTLGTTVLSMATLTGISYTGSGGFTVADMSNTRTFTVGTTAGGSITTAPNLAFTTGASIPTLTTAGWFDNLEFGAISSALAATAQSITGSLNLSPSGTYTGLTASLLSTDTGTLFSNGKTVAALTINGTGGTFSFIDATTITGALTLTAGSVIAYGNISSATFASTGTLTRGITGSSITYTVSGAGATAFSNASGIGISMTNIIISMTNAAAKTFAGGGGSYPTLNQGGAGALTISGANTFDNITNTVRPATITFTSLVTQTFNNFSLAGIAGSLITINSSTAASAATLSKASGIVYGSYLSIRDSTATGGATWYAGPTSTNVSNNTGWVFTQLPIVIMGNLTVADGGFTVSNLPV